MTETQNPKQELPARWLHGDDTPCETPEECSRLGVFVYWPGGQPTAAPMLAV
jgi:hypothetical protein